MQIQFNPIKVSKAVFKETEQCILKFIWNCLCLKIVKTILPKQRKTHGIIPQDFKLLRAIAFKIVLYWNKNRYTDQWKRIKTQKEINLYEQFILKKIQDYTLEEGKFF